MRSLSPSRTLTCTRTVSPDFIAGRSVSCPFSTISIAPITLPPCIAAFQNGRIAELLPLSILPFCHSAILQFPKYLPFFLVERRVLQQVRPPLERPFHRFLFPPPPDFLVVTGQQHVG